MPKPTFVKVGLLASALFPIEIKELGKLIFSKCNPSKALFPIFVIPSSNEISFIFVDVSSKRLLTFNSCVSTPLSIISFVIVVFENN